MLGRKEIINYLKEFSESKSHVHAMWLEGADGLNKVDEYSDIDFWFDVDDDKTQSFLNDCVSALEKLGQIDSRVDNIRAEITQSNIHLKNTSEYLTLDICIQNHTRDRATTCYVENDIAELPFVLFDKSDAITFKKADKVNKQQIKEMFDYNKNRILQKSRVTKYIKRKQYLESYMEYLKQIANPLVAIARLIYTPRHCDYMLCHITNHLPKDIVADLEKYFKVKSYGDILENIENAEILLNKYETILKEKYNI